MSQYDAIVIGGGPAGLSASLSLARAGKRVALIEKQSFGGEIINLDKLDDYPGLAPETSGSQLASAMLEQASQAGVELIMAEVVELENFSRCRTVRCEDGSDYNATVVIIASGAYAKSLGIPGEERLQGRGVFQCSYCDAGFYKDKAVAVCGGGNSALHAALYLARFCSSVFLVNRWPQLSATAVLQQRVQAEPRIRVMNNSAALAIRGDILVEGLEVATAGGNEVLAVEGVLAHDDLRPGVAFLNDLLPLDGQGRIEVNESLETELPLVLAAGNVRSGAEDYAIRATGDGTTAAQTAERLIRGLAG